MSNFDERIVRDSIAGRKSGLILDRSTVIKNVAESCSTGKHVIVVQGKQGVGKTMLAKEIFTALSNQKATRGYLMFIDEIIGDEQLFKVVNMFYTADEGVLVFTDHNDDIAGLRRRIENAISVAGFSRREVEDRSYMMLDVIIHMQHWKIDSYVKKHEDYYRSANSVLDAAINNMQG